MPSAVQVLPGLVTFEHEGRWSIADVAAVGGGLAKQLLIFWVRHQQTRKNHAHAAPRPRRHTLFTS